MTTYLKPVEAAKITKAIQLHLQDVNFDARKYNFRTRFNEESLKRNGLYLTYQKICRDYVKEEDIIKYVTANLVANPARYATDFNDEDYSKFIGRIQGIGYKFQQEIKFLVKNEGGIGKSLIASESVFPPVYTHWKTDKISPETITILNKFTNFVGKVQAPDVFWQYSKVLIIKYESLLFGFIHESPKFFAEIIKKHF